jgi:hypothetical protein
MSGKTHTIKKFQDKSISLSVKENDRDYSVTLIIKDPTSPVKRTWSFETYGSAVSKGFDLLSEYLNGDNVWRLIRE